MRKRPLPRGFELIGETIGNVVLDQRPVLEFVRSARLEQRQQQIVGIAPDSERLPVIVAHDLAAVDERLGHAVNGTPPGFGLQRVGGLFFGLVPGCGEVGILLAHLIDPRPGDAGDLSRDGDDAGVGKRP